MGRLTNAILSAVLACPLLVPTVARSAEQGGKPDPAKGGPLFAKYCAGCHGEDGRGGGGTFQPHVGNLTVKSYIDSLPDNYLIQVISNGGASIGKSAAMPAWKKQLSDEEIRDIVAFVRTLGRE